MSLSKETKGKLIAAHIWHTTLETRDLRFPPVWLFALIIAVIVAIGYLNG